LINETSKLTPNTNWIVFPPQWDAHRNVVIFAVKSEDYIGVNVKRFGFAGNAGYNI
jgi:hypothetical protein